MSKIQDALKKIQSAQNRNSPPKEVQARTNELPEKVATLERVAASGASAQVHSNDGRMVVVDRQLLRDSGLLAPENLERHMADQYRLIKRPILDNVARAEVAADESPMNLIMVASALSGDGKTFTCLNLALSIATEQDTSVLLVDADVAKPHISRLFGIEQEKGLIDLLTNQEMATQSAIIATDVPGLSVLPAGKTNPQATELLASKRMERIVAELSEMQASRVVIFDSPPILSTSESRVLAAQMGQIVMIVCAGHTPQHAVSEALSSLDETKAINMVLNQATDGFGTAGYGFYGYGFNPDRVYRDRSSGSQYD